MGLGEKTASRLESGVVPTHDFDRYTCVQYKPRAVASCLEVVWPKSRSKHAACRVDWGSTGGSPPRKSFHITWSGHRFRAIFGPKMLYLVILGKQDFRTYYTSTLR